MSETDTKKIQIGFVHILSTDETIDTPTSMSTEKDTTLDVSDVDITESSDMEGVEKKELKENDMDDDMDEKIEARCSLCRAIFDKEAKECPRCKQYNLKPGETINLDEVNFVIPLQHPCASGVPHPKMLYENLHQIPIPRTSGDVASDPEIQEHVFNKLPLKEEQKEELLKNLIREQRIQERQKSTSELIDKTKTPKSLGSRTWVRPRERKRQEKISKESS